MSLFVEAPSATLWRAIDQVTEHTDGRDQTSPEAKPQWKSVNEVQRSPELPTCNSLLSDSSRKKTHYLAFHRHTEAYNVPYSTMTQPPVTESATCSHLQAQGQASPMGTCESSELTPCSLHVP